MELKDKLTNTFSLFNVESLLQEYKAFSSGHINDTFLINTNKTTKYVLQKINGNVFKNAEAVITNKAKISQYLLKKKKKTIEFIKTKNGKFFHKDTQNNYWCLSKFIEGSQTFLQTNSENIAFEAGKATGKFLANTSAFHQDLTLVLPKFHSIQFRFQEFEDALKTASKERLKTASSWIDFAVSKKQEMLLLDNAIQQQLLPLRITHNDTKLSNILFDNNGKSICMIDLDTVMKGIIHFDYGDALRTICSTTTEDDKDLSQVDFNLSYFKAYTKGFLSSLKGNISKKELDYLPFSTKIMTFIMGLRFLTDYLNNDIFYKIVYPTHNLARAKNQFTLVKKLIENQAIIANYIKKLS